MKGTYSGTLGSDVVAETAMAARDRIVRVAYTHPRFRGLTHDELEELFDATAEVVVARSSRFTNPDHVRASLWKGMELRARDLFRARSRRGLQADPSTLDEISVDVGADEDRIARDQTLAIVNDFLAAMAPREAEVWKLVHGEELSVAATAKRLDISRHAVGEHLDAATRKLEVFLAIAEAGDWCGRRQADIDRMLGGADDEGTARRALAHLDACTVCRRANAARVRETGRIAAGVLPMPALLAGAHGRSLTERLLDLAAQFGSGSGRAESIGGALLGGGGLATVGKVGAVVATTAAVAVGGATVGDREPAPHRTPTHDASALHVAAPAERPSAATVAPTTSSPPPSHHPARRHTRRKPAAAEEIGQVEPEATTASDGPAKQSGPSEAPASTSSSPEAFLP